MAPTPSAASSLAATRSIATIRDAPASTAPMTHDSPTPPRPMTATLAPAGTAAVLSTAPDPGRHAAADERRDGRVDAVGERDGRRDRHDRRLGHRRDPAVADRTVPPVRVAHDRRPVEHPVAERRASPGRPTAGPPGTRGRPRTGSATARATGCPTRRSVTPGPDRLDDARALVAHRPSASAAATRRRGRAGRSGTRRTPSIRTRTSPARGAASVSGSIRGRVAALAQDRAADRDRAEVAIRSRSRAGARRPGPACTGRRRATTSPHRRRPRSRVVGRPAIGIGDPASPARTASRRDDDRDRARDGPQGIDRRVQRPAASRSSRPRRPASGPRAGTSGR